MAFGLLFLKKILILGGVVGAPVSLVFSDFYSKGAKLEVMSDEATQVTGQKKVAILVANNNKIKSGNGSIDCTKSENQKKLFGIGLLSEINSKQVVGDLIKGGLVPVGCTKESKLEIAGNPANFWYGVLDYENVVVELLQVGTYTNEHKKGQKEWISWDDKVGKWKSEQANEIDLKPYDKCFNKKLPLLSEPLKKAFSDEKIKDDDNRKIKLNSFPDCKDQVFSNQVMTIYTKNGTGEKWQAGSSGWGAFKGAYGDRLSNIRVGDRKIGTSDGKIFYEFPRTVTLKNKS
ncbi:hypothetical protein OVS_01585 [Mycoplasma ovis str. Michigan]|uniref:Uncharacterized protein n=1 Tax=Mycoplasma ovis str. Michigan TaxID=1415773 RepID=A0ABM5P1I0_9MOLU|nr:hypothetical protein [Mycoplasma ovis]AHC40219.1 hypothetical protein OVS_01585 [Mycoplasma ovis str. Michigan]